MGVAEYEMITVLFTLFAVFHLLNALNCRKMSDTSIFKNFGGNKLLFIAFGITAVLQVIITQFGGTFFSTVPLSIETWGKILLIAVSVIGVSELMRLIIFLISKNLNKVHTCVTLYVKKVQ